MRYRKPKDDRFTREWRKKYSASQAAKADLDIVSRFKRKKTCPALALGYAKKRKIA